MSDRMSALMAFGLLPALTKMPKDDLRVLLTREHSCSFMPTIGWNPWTTYTLDPRALPRARSCSGSSRMSATSGTRSTR